MKLVWTQKNRARSACGNYRFEVMGSGRTKRVEAYTLYDNVWLYLGAQRYERSVRYTVETYFECRGVIGGVGWLSNGHPIGYTGQ